jgi:hypothetical protein
MRAGGGARPRPTVWVRSCRPSLASRRYWAHMSRDIVELARRTLALWNDRADQELARQLAPYIEWHHNVGLGTPLEGIYRGREEVLELFTAIRDSFGIARFEVDEARRLSASEVLLLGRLFVEGRDSGAAVSTPFGAVTEIVDGLAVRQRFWTDQSKALAAARLHE